MKNVYLLATDKPSRLHTYKGVLNLAAGEFVAPTIVKNDLINQNIYITSDEDIKMDDWYLDDTNSVRQAITECESYWTHRKKYQKIILTTDTDLIKVDVQAIDNEFLEWFVKNPSYEEVETKVEFIQTSDNLKDGFYYRIIIPKEEQCTCKEHDPYCCQIHGNCPTCVKKEELKQDLEKEMFDLEQELDIPSNLRWHNSKPKQETQGYICPQTKKRCDDECCVSAEDCHIKTTIGIISEPKQETLEYGLLQHIKMCLECNNESQAIRLLEKYGFEKQEEMYSEEEVLEQLNLLYGMKNSLVDTFTDENDYITMKWFEQFKKK